MFLTSRGPLYNADMHDDASAPQSPLQSATQSPPAKGEAASAATHPLTPSLSPAQRQGLRAQAHALKPVVMIGSAGLTEPVLAEIDRALNAHGLIKVRLLEATREEREIMLLAICRQLGVQPVQSIGKLLVLYRLRPEPEPPALTRPKLSLRARPPAAKASTRFGPSARGNSAGRPTTRSERPASDWAPPGGGTRGPIRSATAPRRPIGQRRRDQT